MIKLAIPNKGRLRDKSIQLLRDAGFKFELDDRKLSAQCSNYDMEIYFVRAADIPVLINQKSVDLGVTGMDLVQERQLNLFVFEIVDFGKAKLVLAGPKGVILKQIKWGQDLRIATSFPNITKNYLDKNGYSAAIVCMEGAVEVAPRLNTAELIVDVTSSGVTLQENGLEVLDQVFESSVCLFGRNIEDDAILEEIYAIVELITSVLRAHKKKLLKANVPISGLEKIADIVTGLTGPDVSEILGFPNMRKIEVVVDEEMLPMIIPKIKSFGAKDILILNIEKIIL